MWISGLNSLYSPTITKDSDIFFLSFFLTFSKCRDWQSPILGNFSWSCWCFQKWLVCNTWQRKPVLWRIGVVTGFVETREDHMLWSWASLLQWEHCCSLLMSLDEPPGALMNWWGSHSDSNTPSRLEMLYFVAFLVVLCLLHSFPAFCTRFHVTLSWYHCCWVWTSFQGGWDLP